MRKRVFAAGALAAILLTEVCAVLLCVTVKKVFVGKRWGSDNSTPF